MSAPWMAEAACVGTDPEAFFREGKGGSYAPAAKATCAGCPVRRECLDFALATGELEHGLWGGLTPVERQRLAGKRSDRSGVDEAKIALRLAGAPHVHLNAATAAELYRRLLAAGVGPSSMERRYGLNPARLRRIAERAS